jgi:predicted transcriptional regulator
MSDSAESYRLGVLQLRIMKVLWHDGASSVAAVHQRLDGQPLAYTTVATMLRKMEERGLLRHRARGRRFIYEPAVTAEEVTRSMTHDFVDRLFEGSLASTFSHLLTLREVSHDELAALESLIAKTKKSTQIETPEEETG